LPCGVGTNAAEEVRSIQLVRQIQHPYLLEIENVWCGLGHVGVVMKLADGSLFDLLEVYHSTHGSAIPAEHLCQLLAQIAEVLDFLNTRQHRVNGQTVAIQHCDVHPSNVLLFGETAKLSDFSLTSATTSLMKVHRRAGTPSYI